MTLEEYKKRLQELTAIEFKRFNDDFGGGQKTIEHRIREYVDHPEHERRICQLLGLRTENEKLNEAVLKSAHAADKSADSARMSMIWSGIASIVAILSLFIYIVYVWNSQLSPAKLTGSISYIVMWRFSSNNDGKVTDKKLTPSFWLGNIGARPIIIEDLRLNLKDSNGTECKAYPVNSVPIEAINLSSEFNEYGKLSLGGPFQGFSLAPSEKWQSSYHYHLSEECYKKLKGPTEIYVEIKSQGKKAWERVLKDKLLLGKNGFSFGPMIGAQQSGPIYTEKWEQRKR